ncbi:energy-coupling factor transporter transmembrane component T family protein [Natranaerobius thermophilus]|uniref:Cobalt transport protein n=1 Tax=Natranaerobius thermophilus (strain ATCC BAA-1301 / DSM 18059 / JW/NM-WN-LF) TaxID=457570 RepID=B2A6G6_NATTJ|nr:CbiQ family ECF transporter T component [Natranaerobius thermophilus]ACB85499.1 cobalt transport protein [Natranaerobius thermophilus JW/NM-WN-LF]
MHLERIDYIANFGDSCFHRARPDIKIFFTVLLIILIITSPNLLFLGGLAVFVISLYLIARIPLATTLHLSLYPAFFSLLFAALLSQNSWEVAGIIILRAITAALVLIFLLSTTSYVDIFSRISSLMPSFLADLFLFTYRGIFILLQKSSTMIKAIRLRGGLRPLSLIINIKTTAGMIGLLLIHSITISERVFQVLMIRGYNGSLPCLNFRTNLQREDYLVMFFSIIVLLWAVIIWIRL